MEYDAGLVTLPHICRSTARCCICRCSDGYSVVWSSDAATLVVLQLEELVESRVVERIARRCMSWLPTDGDYLSQVTASLRMVAGCVVQRPVVDLMI